MQSTQTSENKLMVATSVNMARECVRPGDHLPEAMRKNMFFFPGKSTPENP